MENIKFSSECMRFMQNITEELEAACNDKIKRDDFEYSVGTKELISEFENKTHTVKIIQNIEVRINKKYKPRARVKKSNSSANKESHL